MALGTLLHVGAREALHQGMGRLQRTRRWREDVEHATAGGQGLGMAPITEQPVMAQALEAAGEHMQQEAPDELGGWEGHHLDRIAVPIIAPAEVDDAVLQGHEALMADGNPMRIPPEIRDHLLRPREGRLGIDDPVLLPDGVQPLGKRDGLRQRRCPRGKLQLPVGEGSVEAVEILPAKDPREGPGGSDG